MIARVLIAALLAGLVAGLASAAVQLHKVAPLILEAETYEGLSEIWVLDEVKRILGSGPRSSVLSPKEVERLDEIAHESIPEQIKVIRENYKIGAMARILAGPLEGGYARILSIEGDGDKIPWVAMVGVGSFKDAPVELDKLEPIS